MYKFLIALTLSLLVGSLHSGTIAHKASVPTLDQIRDTVVSLTMTNTANPDLLLSCSGTAKSAHSFSTAIHCFNYCAPTKADPAKVECLPFVLSTVNGQAVKVVSSAMRGSDQIEVVVTGVTFQTWAQDGPLPKQGDRVRWFGTQVPFPYIYREGYISYAAPEGILVEGTVCHGDSGAGVFNDQGQVVGVVSSMFSPTDDKACVFMKAYSVDTK